MGKTEGHTNRCKDILCPWIRRINIAKNHHPTRGNLQIQCNRYQITNGIFYRIRTNNFKMEIKKTLNSKNGIEKEQSGGITF